MLSFFASLGIGMRGLQAQRQGVEVSGQNLANVNNSAYARQRLLIQTSPTIQTEIGPQGTGAEAVAIQQLRNALVDSQITSENSVEAFLEAQQEALQYAESSLGEQISSVEGTTSDGSAGLSSSLNDLFNSFQSLSAAPSSITERQTVLTTAQTLASRFNQVDQRLDSMSRSLSNSLSQDVASANELLNNIAQLNDQILSTEFGGAKANDLRDLRQTRIEDLAKLVNIETATQANGAVNISINGNLLVADRHVADTLETYDAGGGQILIRTAASATALTLTGGSIQGNIDTRDGALSELRTQINTLAANLITEVNKIHKAGYSLSGATGAAFFTGTNASDIQVSADLLNDPTRLQASGAADAPGDNKQALALAQLANTRHTSLGSMTFGEDYAQTVAGLGLELSTNNTRLKDQQLVQNMLKKQRDSVSGVSVDEEMTELIKYQKAFEASARVVSTISDMLGEVVNLKR